MAAITMATVVTRSRAFRMVRGGFAVVATTRLPANLSHALRQQGGASWSIEREFAKPAAAGGGLADLNDPRALQAGRPAVLCGASGSRRAYAWRPILRRRMATRTTGSGSA